MRRQHALLVIVVVLLLAVLLAGCAQASEEEEQPSPITPGNGQALYTTYCSKCHGADGQGGTATRIKPPAFEREELFTVIAQGVSGTDMLAFAGVVDENDVDAIMDYLLAK